MPKFDIVMVTWNAELHIENCLNTLAQYTTDYRLIIVDNGSKDNSRILIRKYLKAHDKLIELDQNYGYPKAFNIGIRECESEYIVKLDDDVVFHESVLDTLWEYLQQNPEVALVGPRILTVNGQIFAADHIINDPIYILGRGEPDCGQRSYIRRCDLITGTCWLMRRSLINSVGEFDEQFSPSQFDDVDYCLSVRKKGYGIVYMGSTSLRHISSYRTSTEVAPNYAKLLLKWENLSHFPLRDSDQVDVLNHQALSGSTPATRIIAWRKLVEISPYYLANTSQYFEDLIKTGSFIEAWQMSIYFRKFYTWENSKLLDIRERVYKNGLVFYFKRGQWISMINLLIKCIQEKYFYQHNDKTVKCKMK